MISRLLLLGAAGDLAGRFLLPSLAWLEAAGALPADLQVVAAGAQDGDDAGFRASVAARWDTAAPDLPAAARAAALARLRYRRFDADDPASVAAAAGAFTGTGPVAAYLALPPALFPATLRGLGSAGLPPGSRVAVEKPFGADLAGAVALNGLLAEVSRGDERAVTRVDHFLAMPAVTGLLDRRAAGELGPAEDGRTVAGVEVVWQETLGLEGRADFYDRTGAVRDVLQNHLLQVLVALALEPPAAAADLPAARSAVLRSLRLASADPAACTRRARYTAGTLADGTAVPDYADEEGVAPARCTETHAEVVLALDVPRWAGTRFGVRTGKAVGTARKGVAVRFRDADRDPLWISLEPAAQGPGADGAPGELAAYRAVLTDVLTGGSATSVGAEEAELAWRVVDPALKGWAAGAVPLLENRAGSAGPPPLDPGAPRG
ncbi:Glucose-6-phosphate 1-dehydrogenase [Modestobacter italicus]|uniref:Glucose-6-phosphate 1-dehydrogenase n=1 Tax=Modestobacter italicus (strain DSM 44449 / CECT 9708 / BC 501) TaxID=2732864 RepID=I4EWC1_MODI5|nr:glucose-6-phosphate dehydrogenase [Modestobacter marinus]CCH87684.1 Glucose-6-phosphate 1-dehydrogenase [Modestobacter marinus]